MIILDRKEVLKSPEYWTAKTQIELYNLAESFMKETGRNKTQLAEYLGVSKGYVSQLLNGDYDHRLSKFFELSLAFGVIPQIDFIPVGKYVSDDACSKQFKNIALPNANFVEWNDGEIHVSYSMKSNEIVCPVNTDTPKNAA